jgi:hypothetical protein
VKFELLVAFPLLFVTYILPDVEPGITKATIPVEVEDTLIAATPPIFKVSILLKLVPIIFTNVPIEPELGVKEVIVGLCAINKLIVKN